MCDPVGTRERRSCGPGLEIRVLRLRVWWSTDVFPAPHRVEAEPRSAATSGCSVDPVGQSERHRQSGKSAGGADHAQVVRGRAGAAGCGRRRRPPRPRSLARLPPRHLAPHPGLPGRGRRASHGGAARVPRVRAGRAHHDHLPGGAIPLPQRTRARVLALRVVSGERELLALAAQVRLACRDAGALPEGSGFLAHITIARYRPAGPAEPWLDRLAGVEISWRATEFCLVESRLGAGAGGTVIHQTLQHYQLRPPPAQSRAGLPSSR